MKYKTYQIPVNLNFTKEGFENLKKEQEELLKERPDAVSRLSAMREMGDLSENAGYHAAKQNVSRIDRRLRELKLYLRFGNVIENKLTGKVDLGSTVTVYDGFEDLIFSIVGHTEADPMKGKISNGSPLGSGLMGKKVGDKISVITPEGTHMYEIKKIS